VRIISFGYLHGGPPPAQITIDLRELFRDPHIDPAMRELTGLDQAVVDNVLAQPGARRFAVDLTECLTGLSTVTDTVTVAVGCAGGRHRSVVLANLLANWFADYGYGAATVEHRDLDKPVVQRPAGGVS